MQKKILTLILGIFLIGFIIAIDDYSARDKFDNLKEQREITKQARENAHELGKEIRGQIRQRIIQGDYTIEGDRIRIKKLIKNKIRIHAGDFSADTDLNVSEFFERNKTKLRVRMNDGRFSEIKIMPNVASQRALARLRLKVCSESNNCTIVLKEIGRNGKEITNETQLDEKNKNETRLAYDMRVQKQARFLGIFKTNMKIKAQIDAETGEILRVNKPWWAFMASESKEVMDS